VRDDVVQVAGDSQALLFDAPFRLLFTRQFGKREALVKHRDV